MFTPHKMHNARAGWYIENYDSSIWFHMGKYVFRLGKPWGRYAFVWRPLFSFFKLFK